MSAIDNALISISFDLRIFNAFHNLPVLFSKNTDTCKLWRISLQSYTLEQQKNAVDEAIANNGFLTFYGHSASLDSGDNLTTNNLNSLLDYIKLKILQCECYLLKPCEAADYYFHVRHSDWLELINI